MDSGDTLAPGTLIDDEYRIDGLLGRGGMGVVYRARDVRLDRPVALKVHRNKGLAHERLAREATALARLSHPNVVSEYRVGAHAGRVYVAMELVEGGTLRRSGDPPPWRDVLQLHCAAGDGLAAAHAAGLVHRDFKPDNVLLGADGRPRVADFGLARAAGESSSGPVDPGALATAETIQIATNAPTEGSSVGYPAATAVETPRTPRLDERLTATGAWVGTPAYMAPEQVDGRAVDARSDQFAFAISLWEALHGVRPFAGDTTQVLRSAMRRQELVGADRGDVPRWIDDILRRALRENPDERWPSMDAMLVALRHDPARRRRQLGLAVGAVALAGGAAMIAWQAKSGESSRARCNAGAADIAMTWNPAQAEALRTTFARTKLAYAPVLADKIVAELDRYAAAWAQTQGIACNATANRTWSASLGDRAAACLARRRRALAEAVTVLTSLEGTRIDTALSVTAGLPELDGCGDAAQLEGQEAPPRDPAKAQRYEELASLIARAEAMNDVYDPRAKEVADRAIALAHDVGSARLAAAADSARAETARTLGESDAISRYEESFFESRSAGDESGATVIATRLAQLLLDDGKIDDARTWLRHAEAGSGKDPTLQQLASLAVTHAMVSASDGHYDQALTYLQDAQRRVESAAEADRYLPELLELEGSIVGMMGDLTRSIELGRAALLKAETRFGPGHPKLVSRLGNLGLSLSDAGQHAEAISLLTRAVAICRTAPACQNELGINLLNLGVVEANAHKSEDALRDLAEADGVLAGMGDAALADRALVASARGNVLEQLDRLDESEAEQRRALELTEKANGPDHPEVARVLNNLGSFLNSSKRFAEALPLLERARGIWDKAASDAPDVGLPLLSLGRAQLGLGQPKVAVATLRSAIARLEAGGFAERLPLARLRLAQALWAAGQRDEAKAITKALPIDEVDEGLANEIRTWQSTIGK